ncbi:MAG TPA: hypothetical protein VMU50_20630 [Polyangia bacterium]|nr:hypothetical protein [Polyangia bacterium]
MPRPPNGRTSLPTIFGEPGSTVATSLLLLRVTPGSASLAMKVCVTFIFGAVTFNGRGGN